MNFKSACDSIKYCVPVYMDLRIPDELIGGHQQNRHQAAQMPRR